MGSSKHETTKIMKTENEALRDLLGATYDYLREQWGTDFNPPAYLKNALADARKVMDAAENAARPSPARQTLQPLNPLKS